MAGPCQIGKREAPAPASPSSIGRLVFSGSVLHPGKLLVLSYEQLIKASPAHNPSLDGCCFYGHLLVPIYEDLTRPQRTGAGLHISQRCRSLWLSTLQVQMLRDVTSGVSDFSRKPLSRGAKGDGHWDPLARVTGELPRRKSRA